MEMVQMCLRIFISKKAKEEAFASINTGKLFLTAFYVMKKAN